MNMKLLMIIIYLFLTGCSVTDQQKRRAEASTPFEIVWQSNRGNPYADGKRMYIDPAYISKYRLSLRHVVRHEGGHLKGLDHCISKACVMYPVCPLIGTRDFCTSCKNKLKPTTSSWISKMW